MNRRDLLKTAPLAAVGGALTPLDVRAQGAGAQVTAAQRFAVGEVAVTALSDGFLPVEPNLLAGIDAESFAALLSAAYLDPGAYVAAVNAYLVESGGELWMVDAGTGPGFADSLGQLPGVLAALGHSPGDVSRLIMTHLHPDHVGGAIADGAALFPNAGMILSETEHGFWTSTDIRDQAPEEVRGFFDLARGAVEAYGDRVTLHSGEADVAPGITARPMPGHTPGHTGYVISSGNDSLLIWGDVMHVPPVQLARPEVTIAFDTDQDMAASTRRDLLAELADSGQMMAGMHMAFPGIGYLESAGEGFRFVPAPWQYL